LSVKITDSAVATSLPASPGMSNDYSISSADSDVEVTVWLELYVHIPSPNMFIIQYLFI
jgi:hypothetical protein